MFKTNSLFSWLCSTSLSSTSRTAMPLPETRIFSCTFNLRGPQRHPLGRMGSDPFTYTGSETLGACGPSEKSVFCCHNHYLAYCASLISQLMKAEKPGHGSLSGEDKTMVGRCRLLKVCNGPRSNIELDKILTALVLPMLPQLISRRVTPVVAGLQFSIYLGCTYLSTAPYTRASSLSISEQQSLSC